MNASERAAVKQEIQSYACSGQIDEGAWALFNRYQNVKILERKFIFFSVSLYVRNLRPFMVKLFGEPDLNQ